MASSSSAFLSLSCIITFLAIEANIRFIGTAEDVAVAVVEAVEEEAGGEPAGVLQSRLEADVSLDNDDVWDIWGVSGLGEQLGDVLFLGGEEVLLVTVLEDTGAGDEGCDLSKGGDREPIGLAVVWTDCGEEDTVVVPVKAGHLVAGEGATEGLLETSVRGICVGEGREGPSRTGHDPRVLRGVGVDGKSFCIFPGRNKIRHPF